MSDFLTNLAARSLGLIEAVRPRLPSLYEPVRSLIGPVAAAHSAQIISPQIESEAAQLDNSIDIEPARNRFAQSEHRRIEPSSRVTRMDDSGRSLDPRRIEGRDRDDRPIIDLVFPQEHRAEAMIEPAATGQAPIARPRSASAPQVFPPQPAERNQTAAIFTSTGHNETQAASDLTGPPRKRQAAIESRVKGLLRENGAENAARPSDGLIAPMMQFGDMQSRSSSPYRRSAPGRYAETFGVAANQGAASPEPAIQVTIGRVEVRAVAREEFARSKTDSSAPPVMSLDEYLRRRRGGDGR
jgi:hypothetical protein